MLTETLRSAAAAPVAGDMGRREDGEGAIGGPAGSDRLAGFAGREHGDVAGLRRLSQAMIFGLPAQATARVLSPMSVWRVSIA